MGINDIRKRLAILEATKHPEVLIKKQNMREGTSAAFRTLIEDFPRSTLAKIRGLNQKRKNLLPVSLHNVRKPALTRPKTTTVKNGRS